MAIAHSAHIAWCRVRRKSVPSFREMRIMEKRLESSRGASLIAPTITRRPEAVKSRDVMGGAKT